VGHRATEHDSLLTARPLRASRRVRQFAGHRRRVRPPGEIRQSVHFRGLQHLGVRVAASWPIHFDRHHVAALACGQRLEGVACQRPVGLLQGVPGVVSDRMEAPGYREVPRAKTVG
ncbi:hypothetical protein OXX59_010593, partial [Metschnikowia pulcherrima]